MGENIQIRLGKLTGKLQTELDIYFEMLYPPANTRQALKILLRIQKTQSELNLLLEQLYSDNRRSHLSVVQ